MKIAVVGCGAIAATHVEAIRSAGQEICALCDTETERAERLAERFGLETAVFGDYIEMLDQVKPEVVHVCTPHHLHAPMCVEALGRGIHVLCEKPLCISKEQLEEVLRAERERSAMLGVCHQNRYEPNMRQLKELAEKEGVKGALGMVCWDRDERYYRSGEWRGKWATEGGGVMINQALHTLDLLQWICGMPASVTAHCNNDHLSGVIEVEDTATARFETADGSILSFFATTGGGANFPAQLQIVTKQGNTYYADTAMLTGQGNVLPRALNDPSVGKREWGSGHKSLVADFYRCISQGTQFPISAEEAGKVIRLILAMYASNGEKIEVC